MGLPAGLVSVLGGALAVGLGTVLPARAAGEPVTNLNLGCAAGYAMVNVRPASGANPTTSLNGLTINGGNTTGVPITCAPSTTTQGNGNVLLGGDSNFYDTSTLPFPFSPITNTVPGSPANPQFYKSSTVDTSVGCGFFGTCNLGNTTIVADVLVNQARSDALSVSQYISGFTASGGCSGIALTSCTSTPTPVTFANNSVQTLQGIGGLNFYDVGTFGTNVKLNFVGTPDDFFVFNLPTSTIATNQGWTISGLDPSQIIFNLTGNTSTTNTNGANAADLILSPGANVLGTFLVNSNKNTGCASNGESCNGGTVQMGDNTSLFGSLIVINNANEQPITFGSNTVINGKPFNPARLRRVPGPLPVLGGLAAFGWSRRLRRRLKTSRPAAIA